MVNNEMSSFQSLLYDLLKEEKPLSIFFNNKTEIEVNRFVKTHGSDVVELENRVHTEYGDSTKTYFVNTNQIIYLSY